MLCKAKVLAIQDTPKKGVANIGKGGADDGKGAALVMRE